METLNTRQSLMLRLKADDSVVHELAWSQFHKRYAPIIGGFARKMGGRGQEIEDVVQDVISAFYAKQSTFEYDPSKGRLRGYLKKCTWYMMKKAFRQRRKFDGVPIEDIDVASETVTQAWDAAWEKEQLKRAIELIRQRYHDNNTFRAFRRVALQNAKPEDVAVELGINVESVYKAKQRVTAALREELVKLQDLEG